MALTLANILRSVRTKLHLTQCSKVAPSAESTACIFSKAWRACASKFSETSSPVFKSNGNCPQIYKVLPCGATIAWEYGPTAAGALSVKTTFFVIESLQIYRRRSE